MLKNLRAAEGETEPADDSLWVTTFLRYTQQCNPLVFKVFIIAALNAVRTVRISEATAGLYESAGCRDSGSQARLSKPQRNGQWSSGQLLVCSNGAVRSGIFSPHVEAETTDLRQENARVASHPHTTMSRNPLKKEIK